MKVKYRKLSTGNYVGRYKSFFIFIRKRPHGKWNAIGTNIKDKIYFMEGYHGTSLKTITNAKRWVEEKLNSA